MKKIRVAMNAITELTAKYGSHVYLMELARELTKVESIDLILLVGRGQKSLLPEELQPNAREIAVSASRSYLQLFYQKRIGDFLKREQIDVYHLPNTLPLFWKPIPTVVSIHDLADLRVRKYGLVRTAYRWLINYFSAHLADHVLTLSENSKRDLISLLRIPAERVTVTLAGVHPRFRVLDRAECKKHIQKIYAFDSDFLLAPGGLPRNKNVSNLLLAYAELRRTGIQLPLVVTGHAYKKELSPIQRQIRELHLEDSVVLTGYVDAGDMPFFYGACSLVIYPSLYEGFGLPVVESMASGAPLVVSNTSSLPEIVGNAAVVIDPRDPRGIADAVRLLLRDEQLRRTFVARGLERAALFTWQKAADKVVQVYRDVLSVGEVTASTASLPNLSGHREAGRGLPIKENVREL
jgi:glycosyltransferase involved in cell wall biosynthesis